MWAHLKHLKSLTDLYYTTHSRASCRKIEKMKLDPTVQQSSSTCGSLYSTKWSA